MISALFLSAFLFSSPASAEAAQAGANPAEVTVELTAHDKKGNPVSDLKASDLQIFDGDSPVRLNNLRLNTGTQMPPTVVLIFDQVVPGVAKTDRSLAEELLKAAPAGVQYAVLKVEGRLRLLQAPTVDLEAVRTAIGAATVADHADYTKAFEAAESRMTEATKGAAGPQQASAKRLLAMLLDSQDTVRNDPHSTPSTAALLAASRGLRGMPGRKFLVYYSQGLAWVTSTPENLRAIIDAANQTGLRIYSVDAEIGSEQTASALVAAAATGNARLRGDVASGELSGNPSPEGAGAGTVANENAGRLQSGDKTGNRPPLFTITDRTGGAHVAAAGWEGRHGVQGIAADLGSFYTASWPAPDAGEVGRLRSLVVRPARKGVFIQAPAAYLPRITGEIVSRQQDLLQRALAAPELPTALPVHAALLNFGNTASLLVDAPGADGISVLAELRDKSGAVVHKYSADMAGSTFRRDFAASPGDYVLEAAATDPTGAHVGAKRQNVSIPPATTGLALGDVLLVRRIDPGEGSGASDPLRCAQGVVVPNLSGRIVKAETPSFTIFFDVYPDPASSAVPAFSAELRRDGTLIGAVPLKGTQSKERTIPYLATLGASSLRAGNYEMTVIVSQGDQKVSKKLTFRLE